MVIEKASTSESDPPHEIDGALELSVEADPVMHLLWKPRGISSSRLLNESEQVKPEKSTPPYELKDPVESELQSNPLDC